MAYSGHYILHQATPFELDGISMVEGACFPEAEAASWESLSERIKIFGKHFTCMMREEHVIGYVAGMVTDEWNLTDEMYETPSMHKEKGRWQMIFSVATLPEYQGKGVAEELMKAFIAQAREEGRDGVVLTCKENMMRFYSKFGFVNEGISASTHGGVEWYQMRLFLKTTVYFAGSIRGGRSDANLYRRMIKHIQKKAVVLTEHVGSSKLELEEQGRNQDAKIYEQDTAWLRECDLIIGECTCPSLGVGYELAYAERFNKPCYLFYNKAKTQLSAMLTGNPYYIIYPYEDVNEIFPILDEIL